MATKKEQMSNVFFINIDILFKQLFKAHKYNENTTLQLHACLPNIPKRCSWDIVFRRIGRTAVWIEDNLKT